MSPERSFNIQRIELKHTNPFDPNEAFYTINYGIRNPDGSLTTLELHDNGLYDLRWKGVDETANEFLERAQKLSDSLAGIPGVIPRENATEGTFYILQGRRLERIPDMTKFHPQEILERNNLSIAMLHTLYAIFIFRFTEQPLARTIQTNVNCPQQIADFIEQSSIQIDKRGLLEVLKEIKPSNNN